MFLMPSRDSSRGASCGAVNTNRARCPGNRCNRCNRSNHNWSWMHHMTPMHDMTGMSSRRIMMHTGSRGGVSNRNGSHTTCDQHSRSACHGNEECSERLVFIIFLFFHELIFCFFYVKLNTKMILRRLGTDHSNQRQRLRCADSRY
jgi:hypothetical protein